MPWRCRGKWVHLPNQTQELGTGHNKNTSACFYRTSWWFLKLTISHVFWDLQKISKDILEQAFSYILSRFCAKPVFGSKFEKWPIWAVTFLKRNNSYCIKRSSFCWFKICSIILPQNVPTPKKIKLKSRKWEPHCSLRKQSLFDF